tara:strand:- start:138 stop:437 length:300 start_codon:yes stop_codon:yes gene_type:complete
MEKPMSGRDIIAAVYKSRRDGINRWAAVPMQSRHHPNAKLLLGDDGSRIWVRQWPQIALNIEDDWIVLWEYKHYDIVGFPNLVIDALFTAFAVERPDHV